MKVFSWLIFIGLCIKAGRLLTALLFTLFVNNKAVEDFYNETNLYQLYNFSTVHYIFLTIIILTVIILKAYLFFSIITLFYEINLKTPFNSVIGKLVSKMSMITFSIGLVSVLGNAYTSFLLNKGFESNLTWSNKEFLFISCILYVISLLFKRAIELQIENELTI